MNSHTYIMKLNLRLLQRLVCILVPFILLSCSKEKGTDSTISDGKTKLVIELQGARGVSEAVVNAQGGSLSSSSPTFDQQVIKQQTIKGESEIIVQHSEFSLVSKTGSDKSENVQKASSNQASVPYYPLGYEPLSSGATRALESGITYRMIVYRESDNAFIGETTAVVGQTAPRLNVEYNTRYKWYAYSYNSKDALDPFNVSNTCR